MRILIATDIPLEFVCGSTYFVKRLTALLEKRGHDVRVLCPGRSFKNEVYLYDGITISGIRSIPAIVQKIRLTPPGVIGRSVERAIEDFQPDVVHLQSHFFLPHAALKAAKKKSIGKVGTNHFMPENVMFHIPVFRFFESLLIWLGWKHLHVIFGGLDMVTTPTETAANFLRKSGFPGSVMAISNGIDLDAFSPGFDPSELRERYKIPPGKPVILYVGRLDPEKRVEDVLDALPAALQQTDLHFLIAGRGACGPMLRKKVEALSLQESVTFAGFVPDADLPALYNLADLFVMPGTAELQSIATMEAMASERPVIAVNAMALPELVQEGETGFLYDKGDLPTLSRRLAELCADPAKRERMGKKGREFVSRHSIENTLKAFEDIYAKAHAKAR